MPRHSFVGIIPARGGSKGLPRKNIKPLCGMPLIYWTIQAAKKSKLLSDFYVSTDDDEIEEIAIKFGAKVLKRPKFLAEDTTTTIEVLSHIIEKNPFENIVVLQPTSPLRNEDTIDTCIDEYARGHFDTLATGYYTKILEYAKHHNLRRQDIQGFFYDDGNVYILDRKIIEKKCWFGENICRKNLERELSFEIDDSTDFFIIEKLLKKRIEEKKQEGVLFEQLKNIKLLVLDVDGVLTDAGMYYSATGEELKKFNTKDGHGIQLLQKLGIKICIITGENSEIVKRRAEKLQIELVFTGITDKLKVLKNVLQNLSLSLENVAYIGDDENDLECLQNVAAPFTVADASRRNKESALYITSHKGGEGAVREVCDVVAEALTSTSSR